MATEAEQIWLSLLQVRNRVCVSACVACVAVVYGGWGGVAAAAPATTAFITLNTGNAHAPRGRHEPVLALCTGSLDPYEQRVSSV